MSVITLNLLSLPRDVLTNCIFNKKNLDQCSLLICRFVCRLLRNNIILCHGSGCKICRHRLFHLAVEMSYLDIMKWLYARKFIIPECAYRAATKTGRIDILEWLYCTTGKLNPNCMDTAAERGNMHIITWITSKINWKPTNNYFLLTAAKHGHINVLQWAKSKRIYFCKEIFTVAARHGQLEVMEWCFNQTDIPVDPWASYYVAVQYGHLKILKLLHQKGQNYEELAAVLAARYGHLEILQWVRKLRIPFGDRLCREAAKYGNLKILMWLNKTIKLPLNETHARLAFDSNHMEIVQWLHEVKSITIDTNNNTLLGIFAD